MKICFVGPATSAHIIKWCSWFNMHGHKTYVISFAPGTIDNTEVYSVDVGVDPDGNDIGKIKYLFAGKKIKRIIRTISPDIINVHYATSYGATMALSGIKNYILSVWGSDIYDFPNRSFLHRSLLKFSLRRAAYLFSTSKAMADEASKFTDKDFKITPFGIDMDLFNPDKRNRQSDRPFIIGAVKALTDVYGIEYILKAASILKNEDPEMDFLIRISGDGPKGTELKQLTADLGLEDITTFLGRIPQEKAADEWANMDVAINPSVSYESFGVAVIEAQACGTPVIVTDVAGLLETTLPGVTSMVVPKKDEKAIAEAIRTLYYDSDLCRRMGNAGRDFVVKEYELNYCFEHIENLFSQVCRGASK